MKKTEQIYLQELVLGREWKVRGVRPRAAKGSGGNAVAAEEHEALEAVAGRDVAPPDAHRKALHVFVQNPVQLLHCHPEQSQERERKKKKKGNGREGPLWVSMRNLSFCTTTQDSERRLSK